MVKIIIDSVSGLNKKEAEKLGYGYLPCGVVIDDKKYLDGVDVDSNWVLEKQLQGAKLTTTQPSIGFMEELIEKEAEANDEVLVITVSSKFSGIYDSSSKIAEKYNNVTVFDSYSAGHSIVAMVKKAQELLKTKSLKETVKELESIKESITSYFFPDDIMYLVRGGRANPVLGRFAKLTGITPLLKIHEGKVTKVDKGRSVKSLIKKMHQGFQKDLKFVSKLALMVHGQSDNEIKEVVEMIEEIFKLEVEVLPLSSAVAVHLGPKALGLGVLKIK